MKNTHPGVVFMGTPEFAVASLSAIVNAGIPVKGVVTSADKPSGRGLQMHVSPVKEYALKHGLPVLQPLKLKDPAFLDELRKLNADLQVVVAFRMLPEEVWKMPPMGTFNLHASLLPQYRGAAPINWAIINGETLSGVTTFFLNDEIDKGSVIHQKEVPVDENDTAGDLHDRLMITGSELVVKTIHDIASGNAKAVDQKHITVHNNLKPAPKIFKEDCRIDWNKDAMALYNFIRGLSPYPTAWSELENDRGIRMAVKIFFARPVISNHHDSPGTLRTDRKKFLEVATGKGSISIESIQLQGKKQMPVNEFLRGFQQIDKCRFF